MPASEDPGYHRRLDEYFNYDSCSADSLNTQSLLRLAGNLLQAPHRPTHEPEHGSLSVQSWLDLLLPDTWANHEFSCQISQAGMVVVLSGC